MKHCLKAVAALIAATTAAGMAHAQSAGNSVVGMGWIQLRPVNGGSTPQVMTSINGVPTNQEIAGADVIKPGGGGTLAITVEHYFTDNVSIYLLGGRPGSLKVNGAGNLAGYGAIGKARVISPQLNVRYHFGPSQERFRPFLGFGLNYTKFYDEEITNTPYVTAVLGPGGSATVKASSSWNPVFEAGADYWIDKRWSIGLALSYTPASTTFTIDGRTASGTTSVTKSRLDLNPLTAVLALKYSFQ